MSPSLISTDAFDRALEPVFGIIGQDQAAQIACFHGDEALQARIEELARKANEGELDDRERAEYEGYAQANRFIAVLQASARRIVQSIHGH